MSQYEVRVVVSVNEEEACHLGQSKVIYVYSAQTNSDEVGELKAYGRKITRLIVKFIADFIINKKFKKTKNEG